MLLKLDTVKEIGRFASLKHKAPQFTRLTLIFARNGYGKSTICSILRSAGDGDPTHIAARRRLSAEASCAVQSQWQFAGNVTFDGGKWNLCPGPIHIFDSEYVRQNLHVAESVTRDNKRTVLRVVLGAKGVALADEVANLDLEQRAVSERQRTIERAIQAAQPIVADVQKYCTTDVPADIDSKITAEERNVELAREATLVKQKAAPTGIAIPNLQRVEDLLARTISDVSEGAAALVREHVSTHEMQDGGESWLRYGVEHLQDDQCPFCEQSVTGLDLVSAFKGYFSEEFGRLASERDELVARLRATLGTTGAGIDRSLDANDSDFTFWQRVSSFEQMPRLNAEERQAVKQGIEVLLDLLSKKTENPLRGVHLNEQRAAVENAYRLIGAYNLSVENAVEAIGAAKSAAETIDAKAADDKLKRLRALKSKQSDPLKSLVDEYTRNHLRFSAINSEKKSAQTALKKHVEGSLEDRETRINQLLEQFGANFKIGKSKANFVGREGNVDYCIIIGPHSVSAGESLPDKPSFKTLLSGGDKFTLALAFFITEVEAEPNLAQATVVLDDPFSSQDMQRQFETASQIRVLARQACQVIVFSHDPRFLAQIERDADHGTCSTFQLSCNDHGDGAITAWSTQDELKSQYVRQAEVIREYAHTGLFLTGSDANSLVKDLRPFAEDHLRARCPGRFGQFDHLFEMTQEIEKTGSADPLHSVIGELRTINEFTRPYHHGGAAAAPDKDALRAQCKRMVRILGGY